MFTGIDWVVVGLYMVGMVAMGLWLARGQKSKRDYFLGGRNLNWFVVGVSIVATETSALTFIGVPAMAMGALQRGPDGEFFTTGGNLYFMNIVVGYIIARFIVAFMMVPHYFRGDVYTPYQVLTRAFGPKPRYLAAGLSVFNMTLQAGFRVYVTAIPVMIVLRTVFPNWGILESILLFTVVSILYTSLGGITAVVWTEMVQFFIFFFGGLFAVFYIPTLLTAENGLATESGAEGWAAVTEIAGPWESNHLDIFNSGFVTMEQLETQREAERRREVDLALAQSAVTLQAASTFEGQAPEFAEAAEILTRDRESLVAATLAASPPAQRPGFWGFLWINIKSLFGGPFNIIMGLIGATIGIMVSHGVDQLNVQRVLACKDEKSGRKALLLSAFIIAPQFLIFLMVGAGLFAFYTLNGFDFQGLSPWDPNDPNQVPKADYIFPIFIVNQVPGIVKGFLVAGILAAAMSSLASAMSAISSVAIMDLWRPLRGISGERAGELAMGRWGTLLVGIALVVVAYLAKDATLIFNLVFQFAGIFAGALLGAVLFGMWTKAGQPGPVMAGMLTSSFVMACVVLLTKTTAFAINWPWYPVIGTSVCLGVAYLASIGVPKPTDRSIERATEGEA